MFTTTYDYVMRDKSVLRKPVWQYITLDEGHRMKNSRSKFSQTLGHAYRSQQIAAHGYVVTTCHSNCTRKYPLDVTSHFLLSNTHRYTLPNNLPGGLLNFLLPHIFNSVHNFEDGSWQTV